MTAVHDVAVIGAGAAGLGLAAHLAPARAVLALEAEDAPGRHSSGRSAAVFTTRSARPLTRALAAASRAFLDRPPPGLAATPLLRPRGVLVVADRARRDRLRAAFEAERALDPGLEWLEREAALARAPLLDPDWLGAGFLSDDCLDLDVDALLQGYARLARRAGAEIRLGARLLSARREGGVWALETTAGPARARTIVNAAGGWADAVAAACGAAPLGIVPCRRTAILVEAPGEDVAALPMIDDVDEAFYLKPDAGRLMVSPADETPCAPADLRPEEIDVATAVDRLERATRLRVRRIAASWAGMRSFAPDRAPVAGFARDVDGFFWLAGQGGIGVLSSPALGRLAADLLTGAAPCLPADVVAALDPRRLARAGAAA